MAFAKQRSVALICVSLFVAVGCNGNEGEGGGASPFGSDAPRDPAVAASDAAAALKSCTKTCSANVGAGRDALAEGDIAGALEAYACANTPEAAFGAGLATLLSAFESERMDRVLADFGFEHFVASDVVGSTGWLSRSAERWEGVGMLTLSGDITGEVSITAAMVEESFDLSDPGYLSARGGGGGLHVEIDMDSYLRLGEGMPRSLLYDCSSAAGPASLVTELPFVYLTLEDGSTGTSYECQIPFSRDSTFCQQELGSIEVLAAGTQLGEEVTIALQDVGLSCFAFEGTSDGVSREIAVTGTVTAMVSGELDTSGLHELLQDDVDYSLDRIPANVTVNALLAHGTALTSDLAQAACLFEHAADGDGEVFSVPSGLLGGSDISLNAADAKLLGALAAAGAGALQLGGAYASEVSLRDVACMFSEGDDESGACGETEEHVAKVNAAIASAGVRRDRLAAARAFLLEGLSRFREAVTLMDESSLFPRTATSAGGMDAMSTIAEALERSLEEGEAVLPFVSPSIELHLLELFTNPPVPSSIDIPAFFYEEDCDDFDCYSSLELSASYCSLLWSPLGVDFDDGDYETGAEGDQIEDAFDELESSLESREVFRGGGF
jgi:hypothetical protein